jgi:hypothetical protein
MKKVTSKDLRKNPSKVIKMAKDEPVEVVGDDGTRIVVSYPLVEEDPDIKKLRVYAEVLENQISELKKKALHTLSCYIIEGITRCERGCAVRLVREVLEKDDR